MEKKLYRSNTNKMLAGVCGGFAEYFDVDPTLIRLLYVFLSLLTGCFFGLLMYVIMIAVIPQQ